MYESPLGTLVKRHARRWAILIAFAALALLTAVVFGIQTRGDPSRQSADVGSVSPTQPLPRAWRWERRPVTFEHMFR